jgi:hypothetical protein
MQRCCRTFFSIAAGQRQQRERAERRDDLYRDGEEWESAETIRSRQCDERYR